MARSPFTFAGALALVEPERSKLAGLDKLLGGAILAGGTAAAIAGAPIPVVGVTAATVLSLVDPKNEATRLLEPLVARTVGRIKNNPQAGRYDSVVAAHTITVLSSFFDGLRETIGRPYASLELTEREMVRLAALPDDLGKGASFIEALVSTDVPLPSAGLGVLENLEQRIFPYFRTLATRCLGFFAGLAVWRQLGASGEPTRLIPAIADRAASLYRDRMLRLAHDDTFALWVTLNEHAATRTAQASALGELKAMLPLVMRGWPAQEHSYRAQLALAAKEVLNEPLLRSGTYGGVSPTVEEGFVEPAFKRLTTDPWTTPADERQWNDLTTHESIVDYLAGYLADDRSTELPLLLLGHPGAGKSLLTEVLAAQLPAEYFAVVRVPLRRVNTDDELSVQISKELQRILQRPKADLTELRDECTGNCRLVILLDGFDELIQATGVTQSGYLNKIVDFQKRARTLNVPTSVIITSRTVVAGHADIPSGTQILKLSEFDHPRIDRWLATWNRSHAAVPGYKPLRTADLTDSPSVEELACHPLLLLVLAIYLAEAGQTLLDAGTITQAALYRQILDRFIARQVAEKSATDLEPRQRMAHEALQRRQLQFAAIGMFGRGRQHITDDELDADLAALDPQPTRSAEVAVLSQAHRVLGAFMFVHNAKADREQRGAYEFLHATFGEYLVAELTFEQLVRLDALRGVEAAAPSVGPTQLDDLMLRRALSHQPLSTRQPTLYFLMELTAELDPGRRASLRATLTDLIRSARTRPDNPDELYSPSPYDPVRRRAAYSANLTMLRVLLDLDPVPPTDIIGSRDEADWERHVRLWRAGLDEPAWKTVIATIGTVFQADVLLISERITGHQGAAGEAELIGDRQLMATLALGDHEDRFRWGDVRWPEDELRALRLIAHINSARTGTPYLGQMLPADLGCYFELAGTLDPNTANDQLMMQVVTLLSHDAEYLPLDAVKVLLNRSKQHLENSLALAAVAAVHPSILREIPETRVAITELGISDGTAIVAILWRAAAAHSGDERELLVDLLEEVDQELAGDPDFIFDDIFFTPQFLTYLREAAPARWNTSLRRPGLFDRLSPENLASIEPVDALVVPVVWPDHAVGFALKYLDARGRSIGAAEDVLAVLRQYAEKF